MWQYDNLFLNKSETEGETLDRIKLLQQLKRQLAVASEQLAHTERERDQSAAQLRQALLDLDNAARLAGENKALRAELEEFRAWVATRATSEQMSASDATLGVLKRQLAEEEIQNEDMKLALASSNQKLQLCENDKYSLEQVLEERTSERNLLQEQLNALQQQLSNLLSQLSRSDTEGSMRQNELAELRQQLQKKQQMLVQSEHALTQSQHDVRDVERERDVIQWESEQALELSKRERDEARAERDDVKEAVAKLTADGKQREQTEFELRAEISRLQLALSLSESTNEQLQDRLRQLKEQLAASEASLEAQKVRTHSTLLVA